VSGHWAEGRRPLAMRSQDDRGPAYTAAVEQSEAAFAAVRGVLGDGALVDTAAELAAVAEALPPETPVLLAEWPWIAAGEQTGHGWVEAVGATMAMVAGPPVTPVRDQAGREHDVIRPALQLGVFVLPGPDAGIPQETQACGYYARAIEALEREGPGVSLPAVGALLRHIADLLSPDSDCSPAGYLTDQSPAAGYIAEEAWCLRDAAAALAEIGRAAEAEETAADDEGDGEQAAVTDAMTEAFRAAAAITPGGPFGGAGDPVELAEAADPDEEESSDG
jgi:hypothetical protein